MKKIKCTKCNSEVISNYKELCTPCYSRLRYLKNIKKYKGMAIMTKARHEYYKTIPPEELLRIIGYNNDIKKTLDM